ncbi:hypothetical protein HJC23_000700 [Cyclotella cryptica]|uniref:Uncharacterized protein n=1 Tax=Cyclotella cryptica TaxID=29204 RepID=A0ABD3Q9D2_9STRA|eukprot:CCRYP_007382-RA/>CCRYP_007382-RA protein AED:0.38 eAED:0.38 QI:0/-1/0/1/-1/1/1/0/379
MDANQKKWFLLVDNPSKSNHLGTLLRCAAAFQAHQVLLVGYDKFNCRGSFGSHLFLDIVAFHCWEAVIDYLKSGDWFSVNEGENEAELIQNHVEQISENDDAKSQYNKTQPEERDLTIIGILGAYGGGDEIFSTKGVQVYEHSTGFVSIVPPADDADDSCFESCRGQISDSAESRQSNTQACSLERDIRIPSTQRMLPKSFPIHSRSFSTNVCFLVSKDRRGLPASHARMCDGFVHVPHMNIFDNNMDGNDSDQSLLSRMQATNEEITPTETTSPPLQYMPVTSTKQQQIIAQPSLLDTATILSIVLHHYTAWAGYKERTFSENQKFDKDARPSRVRYLGVGKSYKGNDNNSTDGEHAVESEGYDGALPFWKDTGSSDY